MLENQPESTTPVPMTKPQPTTSLQLSESWNQTAQLSHSQFPTAESYTTNCYCCFSLPSLETTTATYNTVKDKSKNNILKLAEKEISEANLGKQ